VFFTGYVLSFSINPGHKTLFGLITLAAAISLTGCSRKHLVATTQTNSAAVLPNAIKGQISSISEANGLVGWVCEQNMVGSTDLVVYAESDKLQLANIQRVEEKTDKDAIADCALINALPFRFTIPFSSLSTYSGKYISVYE